MEGVLLPQHYVDHDGFIHLGVKTGRIPRRNLEQVNLKVNQDNNDEKTRIQQSEQTQTQIDDERRRLLAQKCLLLR